MGRCPICFLQNISQISPLTLEKKSFDCFLPYLDSDSGLRWTRTDAIKKTLKESLLSYFPLVFLSEFINRQDILADGLFFYFV